MHFQLVEKERQSLPGLWNGAWMIVLMGTLLSLLNSMAYCWTVLPGVALVVAAAYLSRKKGALVGLAVFALCAIWFLLRYMPIVDGFQFLSNRLFDLSEAAQGYCYTHFDVTKPAPAEGLVVASLVIGVLCVWLGGCVNLVLTLWIAVMIAYFGVMPGILWLAALIIVAFVNALPKQGRWLPAILIAAFVTVATCSIHIVAPEPNLQIATIIGNFWEAFLPTEIPPDVEEPPTEPPTEPPVIEDEFDWEEDFEAPEATELPEVSEVPVWPDEDVPEVEVTEPPVVLRPNGPGDGRTYNWGKHAPIGWIILGILIFLSVGYEYNTRKLKRNRSPIRARDNAEAIRGMYLYARRWRKLHKAPEAIAPEVEEIWLEAAYSEHEMTDEKRELMRTFMRETARNTWNTMKWWERLFVRYVYGL